MNNQNDVLEFENYVLNPSVLPEVDQEDFTPIEKKYKRILIFNQILIALLMLIPWTVISIVERESIPLLVAIGVGAAPVLWFVIQLIFLKYSFPKRAYLIRDLDISFKQGLLVFRQVSVPYNRIQHVSVKQSMPERILHLSSLKIYTAGGSSSDLTISGLSEQRAGEIKEFLSEKIAHNE